MFQVSLELLHKAVSLTEEGDRYRAVTYNNFACVFRRTKKLRSALSYLEKALEIEYNYLHFSEQAVDECLQISNPCDIHLNICAILSQMGKHELALQHAMKALILIQDELISKVPMAGADGAAQDAQTQNMDGSQATMTGMPQQSRKPEDRLIVLCIAYHNIAVEQEFLKQYQASLNSYAKAAQSALKYLGDMHPMTQNMNEVLTQATTKIAAIIQKTMSKDQNRYNKGMPMNELESLIRNTNLD